jgi:adenylate cyclase
MQADIAMKIANAVGAEFSLDEQASIERIPTDSADAYRNYLASLELNTNAHRDAKLNLLSLAIESDPNFSLAYASRAIVRARTLPRFLGPTNGSSLVAEQEALALEDVSMALALDPRLARAHLVRAIIESYNWQGRAAQAAFEQAAEYGPRDAGILAVYATFKSAIGQNEEAIEMVQQAVALDPVSVSGAAGPIMEFAGELDRAIAIYSKLFADGAGNTGIYGTNLGLMQVNRGN